MSSSKKAYWAKVFFQEYQAHYIDMTDEQIVADVRSSVVSLVKLDSSNGSFGAKMVGWALERMNGNAAEASKENGTLGGRPRKSDSVGVAPGVVTGTPAPAGNGNGRRKSITRQDVVDFAVQAGLDVNDACECFDATVERGGRDADGKAVKNWKGYVTQWCETRKESRREK